jgi:heat-inducible transcriptional repressor
MLTERQARILELVIGEYVEHAVPVGSQYISEKYQLGVSPATIRNDMGELEAQGYLTHPHTSAGRVPTEKGYRFYVETLMREEDLPWEVQQTIRHQFHQVGRGEEAWHLAASILAQAVRNAAFVTAPATAACRVKHLQLVSLRERTALLVLVLDQGRLKQQVITLEEPLGQDELDVMTAKLNHLFAGLTAEEIAAKPAELSPTEERVLSIVRATMEAVDEGGFEEAYLEGLRHVISQPEFSNSERVLELLEVLDERTLPRVIPFRALASEGVTVLIGARNPRVRAVNEMMREVSIVIGGYGNPSIGAGALAVLGPMRMPYARTISIVRYLADLMSELLMEP